MKYLQLSGNMCRGLLNVARVCDIVDLVGFFFLLDSVLVTPSPEIIQCWKNSYKDLIALFNNVFCIG